VTANFKCYSEKKITSGNYGLEIIATFGANVNDNEGDETITWRFDSSEMLGNPYKFAGAMQQAKEFVWDLSTGKFIKHYAIKLYQDGNFKYLDDTGTEQYLTE
jgi:hypothetical protein